MSALDELSMQELLILRAKYLKDPGKLEAIEARINAIKGNRFSVGDVLAVGAQGAAMGWGDEALAGVTTLGGLMGDYKETRDGYRQYLEDTRNKNPGLYDTIEFGGGFLTPGGLGVKAIQGAKTLPQLAKNLGYTGAGYGAAAGAGYSEGETLPELAWDMTKGAGIGTVANTTIGMGGPLYNAARARGRNAQQVLADIAAEHGITVEKVQARLKELGPEATLADAFPKLRESAYGAYGIGGFIDEQVMLTERNQTAGGRLLSDLEDATGRRPGDVREEVEFLATQRGEFGNEDYSVLDGQLIPIEATVRILGSKTNKAEVRKALDEWQDRTGQSLDSFEKIGGVPAQVLQRIRSLTVQKAEKLRAQNPPQTVEANMLEDRVSLIDNELRSIPGWDEARQNYAVRSAEIENIGLGRTTGRAVNNIDTDQGVLERVLNPDLTTERNRNAYALGAQQQIIDNILAAGGANDTGSVISRLGNPRQQEIKLEGAGIPEYRKKIDRERSFNETYMMIGENQGAKTNAGRTAKEVFEDESSLLTGALRTGMDPTIMGVEAAAQAIRKAYGLKSKTAAQKFLRLLLRQNKNMTPADIVALLDTETGARQLMEMIQKGSRYTGPAGIGATGVLTDRAVN